MTLALTQQESLLTERVKTAGEALLTFWPGGDRKSDLQIERKKDGSAVTNADFESNRIVIEALKEAFPDDGILSEELPPDTQLAKKSRVWIIDPLDGTQSFVDGNDDFSVLVALTEDGAPTFGLMYFPARKKYAMAKTGKGAWRDGTRMKVSGSARLRDRSVYVRHFEPVRSAPVYDRWMDSGCAFLTLAEGGFDGLIIKIVSHREWDLAAPAVVVQESGGRVSDEFGNPVTFRPGAFSLTGSDGDSERARVGERPSRYFVASNGITHDELLKLIPEEDRK